MTDLTIQNHGSIVLIQPITDAGKSWLDEHINPEALTWGTAIVAEPRYVSAITRGAREDGLEVS
jgi:hypothetical protein